MPRRCGPSIGPGPRSPDGAIRGPPSCRDAPVGNGRISRGQLAAVRRAAAVGSQGALPFPVLALADDPELQLQCSRILANSHPRIPAVPLAGRYPRHERIPARPAIGGFSIIMRRCNCSWRRSRRTDRDRFEAHCILVRRRQGDSWRARVEKGFDAFVDVRLKEDGAVAQVASRTRSTSRST